MKKYNDYYLTENVIQQIYNEINGYLPEQTRIKIKDFRQRHPNFTNFSLDGNIRKNWWEYMVQSCNNSKTRYESLLKVLEYPKERGSIVLQFITEYYYEDNLFMEELRNNNVTHLTFSTRNIIYTENECEDVISWTEYWTLTNEELKNVLYKRYSVDFVNPDKLKKIIELSKVIDQYIDKDILYKYVIEQYFNSGRNKGVLFNSLK